MKHSSSFMADVVKATRAYPGEVCYFPEWRYLVDGYLRWWAYNDICLV
jgi:hypothetical protein